MELLLILSALLSTLTGVVTGVRAPNVQVARCAAAQPAAVAAQAPRPSVGGHRHLLGAIDRRSVFARNAPVVHTPVPAVRLYLDRIRA